jgi:hypothetical protein
VQHVTRQCTHTRTHTHTHTHTHTNIHTRARACAQSTFNLQLHSTPCADSHTTVATAQYTSRSHPLRHCGRAIISGRARVLALELTKTSMTRMRSATMRCVSAIDLHTRSLAHAHAHAHTRTHAHTHTHTRTHARARKRKRKRVRAFSPLTGQRRMCHCARRYAHSIADELTRSHFSHSLARFTHSTDLARPHSHTFLTLARSLHSLNRLCLSALAHTPSRTTVQHGGKSGGRKTVEQVLPWRHHALTGNRAMATTAVALTQTILTFVVPLPYVV